MGAPAAQSRLPVVPHPLGGFPGLVMWMHELTVKGRNWEALRATDIVEVMARAVDDTRALPFVTQTRMYALKGLGRLQEALAAGESLLRLHRAAGATVDEAKTLTGIAEILIRMGRLDEGLHLVARAITILDQTPRNHRRYRSAVSSLADAARAAELYELADSSARIQVEGLEPGSADREAGELQRAELLVEWALRLEHIGQLEEATARYLLSVRLIQPWVEAYRRSGPTADAPLATAVLASALVKLGRTDEAAELVEPMILTMRERSQRHEARLAHFAYGVVLRVRGDYQGARRELTAAVELSTYAGQTTHRLIFQYELALLAIAEHPETRHVLSALQAHARHVWNLRLERIVALRQARRRMELEAEANRADAAALQDPLTGLGNRRCFDQQMALLSLDDRRPEQLVLLLVDVDTFKGINDTYSHAAGDRVLIEIATALKAHCRSADVPVRFGGDEFAVFIRGDLSTAARIGERIRRRIAAHSWNEIALGMRVTVSLGAAALRDGMTASQLFEAADRQLYAAKRRGRDQLAA